MNTKEMDETIDRCSVSLRNFNSEEEPELVSFSLEFNETATEI